MSIVTAVAGIDRLRDEVAGSNGTITPLVVELARVRRQLADTRAELEQARAALAWQAR